MSFEEKKYQVIRQGLDKQLLKYIQINLDNQERLDLFSHMKNYNTSFFQKNNYNLQYPMSDDQCRFSYKKYGSIAGDSLLEFLNEDINNLTNKKLTPAYSYFRSYYYGSILEPHVDRISCEYSATVCIKKGKHDWPIYFEDLDKKEISVELEPGDYVVYEGSVLSHWRNPYKGDRHVQLFLHYVQQDGTFHMLKNDSRPYLGLPQDYRDKYGVRILNKKYSHSEV